MEMNGTKRHERFYFMLPNLSVYPCQSIRIPPRSRYVVNIPQLIPPTLYDCQLRRILFEPNFYAFLSSLFLVRSVSEMQLSAAVVIGIISTVAGNGGIGYNGDGVAATAASLNYPFGLAVDTTGNIYIADYRNNRIRMISTTGIISTVAGNGSPGYSGDNHPATSAELNQPLGVAVDATGNIYIADTSNNRIRMVSTSGIISTVAGTGVPDFSGDDHPAITAALS